MPFLRLNKIDTQIHCTFTAPNGTFYDLSPLMNYDDDHKLSIPNDGQGNHVEYKMNVCKPTTTSSCSTDSALCVETKPMEEDSDKEYVQSVRHLCHFNEKFAILFAKFYFRKC